MISVADVKNLANLARLDLSSDEEVKLQKDLESILGYIEQLQAFSAGTNTDVSLHTALVKNVSRADQEALPTGANTDVLLAEAPAIKDNYVSVKAIM